MANEERIANTATAKTAQCSLVLSNRFCLFSYYYDTQADELLILSAIQSTKISEANNLTKLAIKAIRVILASVLKKIAAGMWGDRPIYSHECTLHRQIFINVIGGRGVEGLILSQIGHHISHGEKKKPEKNVCPCSGR